MDLRGPGHVPARFGAMREADRRPRRDGPAIPTTAPEDAHRFRHRGVRAFVPAPDLPAISVRPTDTARRPARRACGLKPGRDPSRERPRETADPGIRFEVEGRRERVFPCATLSTGACAAAAGASPVSSPESGRGKPSHRNLHGALRLRNTEYVAPPEIASPGSGRRQFEGPSAVGRGWGAGANFGIGPGGPSPTGARARVPWRPFGGRAGRLSAMGPVADRTRIPRQSGRAVVLNTVRSAKDDCIRATPGRRDRCCPWMRAKSSVSSVATFRM